nr:hypothetical protein [Butyrivibrio sp. FCS014]
MRRAPSAIGRGKVLILLPEKSAICKALDISPIELFYDEDIPKKESPQFSSIETLRDRYKVNSVRALPEILERIELNIIEE